MPSSFFSRQDVEQWVPKPSPSRSEGGFVAKLFPCIHEALASLTRSQFTIDRDIGKKFQNEVERFFLWGQGLDAIEGGLDEVLSRSKELRVRVLALLLRLGTAVLQGLSHGKGDSESSNAMEQYKHMRSMLEGTESMVQELESDESTRPYTPMGSDLSEYGATEILEEISAYIDCLLDLSPSLENPAFDIQHEGSDGRPERSDERFDVSSEEALIYCRRIRDRFEALPKYLVERLAEINRLRAESLRRLRELHSEVGKALPVPDDVTEDRFSASDPPLTKTTGSTLPSSSNFSSALQHSRPRETFLDDEDASQATFASFSTSASAVSFGRPRVPPMPETLADGWNKLPCSVCFVDVSYIRTRKEWKKHVFDDLKPYVCTITSCERSWTQFKRSGDWACHEQLHRSSESPSDGDSAECLFCGGIYKYAGGAYYKHVSAHLREVSLFVLPRPIDEEEGVDSDDTDGSEFGFDNDIHRDSPEQPYASHDGRIHGEGTQANNSELNLDSIIERLLQPTRDGLTGPICLDEAEVLWLCSEARTIFLAQPTLLECDAPLKVVGDIRGRYQDFVKIFEYGGLPPTSSYMLLGNCIDFVSAPLERFCLILAMKIKYPDNFWPLRGNSGTISLVPNFVQRMFREGIVQRHLSDSSLWDTFDGVFSSMPLAGIVAGRIFCVHGGLSPSLETMEQIRGIVRPTNTSVADTRLLYDLLYNTFDEDVSDWVKEFPGSLKFGPDVVERFVEKHNLDFIVTGSRHPPNGYEFSVGRKLLALASAPRPWIQSAIMSIHQNRVCTLHVRSILKDENYETSLEWTYGQTPVHINATN